MEIGMSEPHCCIFLRRQFLYIGGSPHDNTVKGYLQPWLFVSEPPDTASGSPARVEVWTADVKDSQVLIGRRVTRRH